MSASSSAISTRCGLVPSASVVMRPLSRRRFMITECGRRNGCRRRVRDPLWWLLAQALVSQLAEETDSKPVQCEFESHRGHQKARSPLDTRTDGIDATNAPAPAGPPWA